MVHLFQALGYLNVESEGEKIADFIGQEKQGDNNTVNLGYILQAGRHVLSDI